MSEAYVECLIKAKPSLGGMVLKYLLAVLTVAAAVLYFITGILILFILAILMGVGTYFAAAAADVEYEYLYLDKELTIDKVIAKSKRKKIGVYQLDRIEILAPVKSYHLDSFRNRTVKEKDYSIGFEEQPDRRYAMYYEGGEKILISPSEELIKVMRNVAPRKVFID